MKKKIMLAVLLAATAHAAAGSHASATLPLAFEPNQGQAAAAAEYIVRARDYTAELRPTGVTLHLSQRSGRSGTDERPGLSTARHASVSLRFAGANNEAIASPLERAPGQSHYLKGRDPDRWIRNVPHYERLRYEGVYPGIDLIYYGSAGRLQYDFVVAPGADPEAIRLQFDRQAEVDIEDSGQLAIDTAAGVVRHAAPVVYQGAGEDSRRVEGRFVKHEDGAIGFRVAEFDPAESLVIDPRIEVSSYLGGSGSDEGWALARDDAGNIVVAGSTTSIDFPIAGQVQAGNAGDQDAFVARFDSTGTTLLSATYFGGSGDDIVYVVEIDNAGDIVAAGYTLSPDLPTVNAIQDTLMGGDINVGDSLLFKLNAAADTILYSTYLGGLDLILDVDGLSGREQARDIFIDSANNVYLTGETASPGFPVTHVLNGRACLAGETDPITQFVADLFVAKIAADGALIFSTCLGSDGRDVGRGIAVHTDGSIWLNGYTASSEFPVTPDAFQLVNPTTFFSYAIHVTRLNSTATTIDYATYVGGRDFAYSQESTIDAAGNYYIVGYTIDSEFPTTPGAFQTVHSGPFDSSARFEAVVLSFAGADNSLRFSTFLGGHGEDRGWGIELGPGGRIYVAGRTASFDFPGAIPVQGNRGRLYAQPFPLTTDIGQTNSLVHDDNLLGAGMLDDFVVAGNTGVNRLYRRPAGSGQWSVSDIGSATSVTRAVMLFDMTADGYPDLITGNEGDVNRIYVNDTTGGFGPGSAIGVETESTRGVGAGYFGGGSGADVVVANFGASDRIYYDPTGTPSMQVLAGGATPSTAVAVAELNTPSGRNDLVFAREGAPNAIYLFQGAGGFGTPIEFGLPAANTQSLAIGDLDGDGDEDIVTANCGSPNRVYLNDGAGGMDAGSDIDSDVFCTRTIELTYANPDFVLDVVVGNDSPHPDYVYINTGAGVFERLDTVDDSIADTKDIFSSEFSGDLWVAREGAPNASFPRTPMDIFLAVLDPTGSSLETAIYLGADGDDILHWGLAVDADGDAWLGGTSNSTEFPTVNALQTANAGANDVVIAEIVLDEDRDGVLDGSDNCLAVANPNQRDTDSDGVGNDCDPDIAPTPNDCLVNFADLNALKIAFFSTPADPTWNADADLDGDNAVNFADLLIMKLSFFGSPGPSGTPNDCE